MTTWQNWAGNQAMSPAQVLHPASAAEIAEAVKEAASQGRRVKAIGSGHSFTSIGLTDGALLQLDRFDQLIALEGSTVTVQAGLPIARLNALLDEHGLGLTNMGDIDVQTVAGAISTGTHGTGRASGSIAHQVVALELVLADGSIVSCSRTERPELFEMARVGLGALGIVSTVTFQAEPAFALHADERPMPLDEVLEGFEDLVADNEHFEFYWFPHTRLALTKRNNRTTDLAPLSKRRAWIDDELLSNGLFGLTCRLGSVAPRLIPGINKVAARALTARTYSDVAPHVFTSPRRVRFCEMEYAIPRADLPAVFRELSVLPEKIGEHVSFPVEVRVAPADDIPLSTASGRDSAYIAVHVFRGTRFDRYFNAVESLMGSVGGRPHWGKLHNLSSVELAQRYPRFEDFRALRRAVDPDGLFRNTYLDKVLGPV